MQLFKCESSDPRTNAQRNLMGRTHYVDDDTLRWHRSRVLSARHTDGGLLFAITTSDALDMNNRRRGFRYVIFDVFGTVLSRPDLKDAFRNHEKCKKAMWAELEALDARAHTYAAIEQARDAYVKELEWFRRTVDALGQEKAA